jgi:hypothetical protein
MPDTPGLLPCHGRADRRLLRQQHGEDDREQHDEHGGGVVSS